MDAKAAGYVLLEMATAMYMFSVRISREAARLESVGQALLKEACAVKGDEDNEMAKG